MRILSTLIAIISAIVAGQAQSIGRAPLGLEWGLSQEETKKLGVELTSQRDDSFGKAVIFTKLPQTIADADTVLGSYGYDDRLYRIVILSKQFSNDPSGNAVLSRYSTLGAILSEKYGRAAQTHHMGDSIYAEQRYFVAGIQNGRTYWYSNYLAPDLFVQLGIIAEDSSTSRWRIIYENKALKGNFEQAKRAKEKGTLNSGQPQRQKS
jgi:hypothetical protein